MVIDVVGDNGRFNMINIQEGQIQLCTFVVNERLFGVDILHVREVSTENRITPIPHAPDTVRGFVNLRGQVHLVLDLRRIMGYPDAEDITESRLVLFKERVGQSFGMLVDGVGDIRVVEKDKIVDRRQGEQNANSETRRVERSRMVQGVVMVEDGLILVLRARELLARFKEL